MLHRALLGAGGGGAFIATGLWPNADISAVKDVGNPTYNFACLPENIIKVGSTYYSPYTVSTSGDVRLATASDRDGPWATGSVIFAQSSVSWRGSSVLYAPHIMEDSGTFYLFYACDSSSVAATNAVGVATASSITGPYTDHGSSIMGIGSGGAWDSRRVGEVSVIKVGSTWVMAYMGESDAAAYQASEKIGIATASSPTGTWTKSASNPIIGFGTGGQWDDALIADPDLFYVNGYYWIWYAGGIDAGPSTRAEEGFAYASTPDGPWTRHAGNPILPVGAGGSFDDVWVFRGGLWLEDGEWGGTYAAYDGANFKGGNFRLMITN